MKNELKSIYYKFVSPFRNKYYKIKKRKLKNVSPTIISSDCFGTFVYHNLGLKFRSPTINLFFSNQDFWIFVNDLESFLSAEVIEEKDRSVQYPVGSITANEKKVYINFMHYKSFEEAKEKWDERKQRVSFDNIYIIQVIPKATSYDVEQFDLIPFKNKMLVTSSCIESKTGTVAVHKVMQKKNYKVGQIFKYPTLLSFKRYMDDIDYVSFLNQQQ